jgi:hypothetical protein
MDATTEDIDEHPFDNETESRRPDRGEQGSNRKKFRRHNRQAGRETTNFVAIFGTLQEKFT